MAESGTESWPIGGPDWSDIDLSIYAPGAHRPRGMEAGLEYGDEGYEPCCVDHNAKHDDYTHEADLVVKDGRHVVYLYWSELPLAGVHTGWGGSDIWACRCGWFDNDDWVEGEWPGAPPFGDAMTPERFARIEWDKTQSWWHPADYDFARCHAYAHKGMFIKPGWGEPMPWNRPRQND